MKKLLSETAIYGMSTIFGRLLNYALVPLHTQVFSQNQYGTISIFYANIALLNVVFLYGMETAFFRFSTKAEADKNAIFNLCQTLLLASTAVFVLIFLYSSKPIAEYYHFADLRYIYYFIGILAIDTVVALPFARLRLQNKAFSFAGLKMINIAVNVGLNLYFFWFEKQTDIGYVFIANLIANALLVPLLWENWLVFRPKFNFQNLKPIFLYAYPILFTGLTAAFNEVMDRNLLQIWLPSETATAQIGIYSACYKLSIFITLAVQAFKFAAEPYFFQQAQNKNSPEVFAQIMYYFVMACGLMYVGVSLNLDWISAIFLQKKEYREGIGIVPILLLANVFLGIYYNLAIWFKLKDKTYYGTYIGLFGVAITLIINYLLIPIWGYWGSALATLFCYASMVVLSYFLGQKHFPIPYRLRAGLFYLFLASILIGLGFFFRLENFWANFFFQNTLLLVYVAVLGFGLRKKRILV